jgi:hypothetical protein
MNKSCNVKSEIVSNKRERDFVKSPKKRQFNQVIQIRSTIESEQATSTALANLSFQIFT